VKDFVKYTEGVLLIRNESVL